MELTKAGKIIKGFKATDSNMCCRGFQYELGTWYEHIGDISLCNSGFHFCEYPSGPFAYYDNDCRIFECEAEEVLLSREPGADRKHVAQKIRLTKEITPTGDRNTGDGNTGDRNTGDRNTGYGNTGDGNTGDGNTGRRNTGDGNTGYGNTGDGNTGDGNTGDWNTGDGNCGNYHSGSLCFGEAPFFLFNKPANREDVDFNLVFQLSQELTLDKKIEDIDKYLCLPNATKAAINKLHKAHIEARKKNK